MILRRFVALLLAAITVCLAFLPASTAAADREVFFAETGHTVKGDFLNFFEQKGGLTIFGYPRTDAILEGGRTVQYFQRARFEAWPENPAPYNVQLMLIGDAVMGPGDPPIPASQIPSPDDPQRRYFPETGHTVAFAFLGFFNSNGGLTIFGYPTSEAYTLDGRLVQIFQRARFEWAPENPDPYKVELGLLGDEYIYKMGRVPLALTQPAARTAAVSAVAASTSSQGKLAIMLAAGGDIMVVNPDGTGMRRLTSGIDPAWSSDGSKLAVARWDDPRGIYVVDANTGAETRVLSIDGVRLPTWSPDGSQIAFMAPFIGYLPARGPGGRPISIPDQRYRISAVKLADGSTYDLPDELHSYSPSWSPDGNSIVFKGDKGLYLTDPNNGDRLIPGTDSRYLEPIWSPDGSRIAFVWKQHDHTEIAVINWDGSGFQNLTSTQVFGSTPSNNVSPAWSPDGSKIAFLTDREGAWKVYVMNADGSGQTKLLDQPIDYQSASERVIAWGR